MKTAILSTMLLAGCGSLVQQNADVAGLLAAGKPVPMWGADCAGYVVQSGLPLPLGQRMTALDRLCPGPFVAPVAVPSAPK